jgi:hypothetical protein
LAGIVAQAILNCSIFGIRILHYSDNYTEAPLVLMISLTICFFLSDVLKDKNSLFKEFIKREKNQDFSKFKVTIKHFVEATAQQMLISSKLVTFKLGALGSEDVQAN